MQPSIYVIFVGVIPPPKCEMSQLRRRSCFLLGRRCTNRLRLVVEKAGSASTAHVLLAAVSSP